MDRARADRLHELEERLGHHFSDLGLLDRALTHTSRANEEATGTGHNESLEFLGDSVLGFVISDLLHRRRPDGAEGDKSRHRAHLVSASCLADKAAALGVPELLLLGRGEEKTGGRHKRALWSDAYEAVVAALYLDGGIEAARDFVGSAFAADLEAEVIHGERDPKSALQELLQGRGSPVPEYVVVAEEGPSHRRVFRVRCVIEGAPAAEAEGPSKKAAQQAAARAALLALRSSPGTAENRDAR